MPIIEMTIDSVRVSMINYQRVVILKEKEGARYLPIWIGPAEADAIAGTLQGVSTSRPLTHDFTCAAIDAVGARLQSVVVDKLEDDCFYAKVILEGDRGEKEVDCRPSDALAMAARQDVRIFADERVLKKAGMLLDEGTEEVSQSSLEEMAVGQKASRGHVDVFSEAVQDVLAKSEVEATRLNCGYVCTGHLLVALTKEANTATSIIRDAGVNLAEVQREMEALMREECAVEGGGVGLTPALKEAMQIAIDEAKRLGSAKVLAEHILLGLARASDGIAAKQLKASAITPEAVYVRLIRLNAGNRLWQGWQEKQLGQPSS